MLNKQQIEIKENIYNNLLTRLQMELQPGNEVLAALKKRTNIRIYVDCLISSVVEELFKSE